MGTSNCDIQLYSNHICFSTSEELACYGELRVINRTTYNELHCKDMPENIFSVGRESFKRAFQFSCLSTYFCCSLPCVSKVSARAVGLNSSELAASFPCFASVSVCSPAEEGISLNLDYNLRTCAEPAWDSITTQDKGCLHRCKTSLKVFEASSCQKQRRKLVVTWS